MNMTATGWEGQVSCLQTYFGGNIFQKDKKMYQQMTERQKMNQSSNLRKPIFHNFKLPHTTKIKTEVQNKR